MFKQYIFLLILSLFSIQGFAAGCPDGSEPVKSLSADGTYFVFECNNNTQNSSSANQNFDITIVNKSSFPTKTLQEWANSASSKMASRESDILVLLYDVGQVINPVKNLYGIFRLHQVLMSPKEINESKKLIEDWFINSGCSGGADYGLMNDIKVGLDKGLDWSSQWILCTNKRLIVMALPEEMRSNPNGQDAVFIDIQGFLQHELYHAFQHDLANTGECRNRRDKKNSNSSWMIEGGARYFAERLLPFPKADFKDLILRPIYENKMVLGDAEDVVGAAILLLMIERGLINESEIMDGSLFHDCARELKFDKNSDEMKFVLSNWNNEEYEFSPEILLDYDASKPSKDENKEDATSNEPPFSGTISIDPNIVTAEDPSSFKSISYKGTGYREMYDRRSSWVNLQPFLFEAKFEDGSIIEMQVNPEFKDKSMAEVEAKKYAFLIGQLPAVLRKDIQTSWIHKGINPYGGGNNNILIHTGQTKEYERDGILEETLILAASHTSLDSYHANNYAWLDAQSSDNNFISNYARDNPLWEDIAESFLTYIAVVHRSDRISSSLKSTILKTIPNRIKYFDNQNFDLSIYSR